MTQRPYQELLARLRDTFPAPVSDRKHDAYFVFSILRALDQVDDLKSEVPLLGRPRTLDYAAAERAELSEEGRSVEEVARQLVGQLEGMPIWGHPRTQINVVPPPSIPSVIGSLLPAIYNPNLVSDDTSYGLMLTEAAVVAMVSRLVGYDPARAAGVFTFGGTGTVLYGAKLGIEKAFPDAMDNGVPGGGMILASAQSHYCRLNVAGWLGLGEKSVVAVPTHLENDIRVDGWRRSPERRSTRGGASWRWWRRWARPTRSASTTSTASPTCATGWSRTTTSTTGHTSTPTPSSAGLGRCSTTTTSKRTRSAFGRAPCARWRRRGGASPSCTGPTRSASTSTRPGSPPTSQACSWPATAPTCSFSSAAGNRCRTCSRAASAIPGCSRWRRHAAGRGCSRPTPTYSSSDRWACASYSATSWRWRKRSASI